MKDFNTITEFEYNTAKIKIFQRENVIQILDTQDREPEVFMELARHIQKYLVAEFTDKDAKTVFKIGKVINKDKY
jgi:hypothetical protein